jgi:hypothetical protein
MSGSSPLLQAARLWERTSARGTRYMSGRLGGVRVVIMPNRDFAENELANSHTHILYFRDGSTVQPRPEERTTEDSLANGRQAPASTEPRERSRKAAAAPRGGPIEDDP